MKLSIILEYRFWRTPDGRCWSEAIGARPYWSRYLSVFSEVKIIARVHEARTTGPLWTRIDGDGVTVEAIPPYLGPWEFVRNARKVRAAIVRALSDDSAILLRVPSVLGWLASSIFGLDRPYGLEVVGDPHDVFSPGAVSHPARPLLRYGFTRVLQHQCKRSPCVLYVTESALQRRYPTHPAEGAVRSFSIGVSDVELPAIAFVKEGRLLPPAGYLPNAGRHGRFAIIFVGALEVPYKAPDVLLRAFAQCVGAGLDAQLTMVGSGRLQPNMERLAQGLGVRDRVRFLGFLPAGDAVREQLDASDLFVLPSRTEGLPRAILEAMARGLPCIGTSVGGIPELLPPEALVKPGDAKQLAAKILELAANPERRAAWAQSNLKKAHQYRDEVLQPKRVLFYQHLRDLTLAWLRKGQASSASSFAKASQASSSTEPRH